MQTRRLLSDQEEIVYQTRKHWAVFLKAAVYFALAYAAYKSVDPLLAMAQFTPPEDLKRILPPIIHWSVKGSCYLVTAIFGLMGLSRLLGFFSNKVIVTRKRVIRQDVLSGSVFSLDLRRVESVTACTGLLGSLLGYGRVTMVAGSGQKISIANLRRPHELERELFGAK